MGMSTTTSNQLKDKLYRDVSSQQQRVNITGHMGMSATISKHIKEYKAVEMLIFADFITIHPMLMSGTTCKQDKLHRQLHGYIANIPEQHSKEMPTATCKCLK